MPGPQLSGPTKQASRVQTASLTVSMSGRRSQSPPRVRTSPDMATPGRRRRSRSPPSTSSLPGSPVPTTSSAYFLPQLIPEVARRLTSLQDFFALRATCRAALPVTAANLASQAPLLLFVPRDRTQPHVLFHLPLRRIIHRFRLPHSSIPGANRVVTESHTFGCRLAINNNYSCGLPKRDLSIIHLLTGQQACCLPSPRAAVSRLLLCGDLAVAWSRDDILYCRDSIQYCRLGASRWRVATISSFPNEFTDLIFVKGTLYALVNPGNRVAVVELPDDDDNNNNNLKLEFLGSPLNMLDHESVFCLAECSGELLIVIRETRGFHVLQWQAGKGKWLRITSLGGCTLFFADSCFSGCLVPNHPGIQGDCIYITLRMTCLVFSLIDQSADVIFVDDPRRAISDYCSTPLWVFPSMC